MIAKKSYKKRYKQKRGVAFVPRGGFAVPGSGRPRIKPGTVPLKPFLGPKGKGTFSERFGKVIYTAAGRNADKFKWALLAAGSDYAYSKIKGTTYGQLPGFDSPGKKERQKTVGEWNTTAGPRMGAESVNGNVYKTKFLVGAPPTRSVLNAEKQQGSGIRRMYDTKVSVATESERESLILRAGFNQKAVAMWEPSTTTTGDSRFSGTYWTYGDMINLFNLSSFSTSPIEQYKVYVDSHYFGTKFTLSNINKYLDMTVKVTWYRKDLLSATPHLSFVRATSANFVDPQKEGAIPRVLQLTQRDTNGLQTWFMTDPRQGGLHTSEHWNNVTTKVKSFTQKLKPGDDWIIDYRHMTGPGLRIDQLAEAAKAGSGVVDDAPLFYFPVIEMKGPLVECFNSVNSNLRYSGTGSGALLVNFEKYCKIGNRKDVIENPVGFKVGAGYRVYEITAPVYESTSKILNFDYANILAEGDTTASDKYIIPGTTDVQVVRSGGALK